MSIRIDWQQIKNNLGASYDAPMLFVMPSAGRQLLLSLSNRLTWEACYRVNDYDFSDWDELQAIVNFTEYGLMKGVNVDDLISVLLQMVNEIRNMKISMQTTVQCCDQVQPITEDSGLIVDEGNVPATYGDETTETWADYKQYICGASSAWVDGMISLLYRLSDAVDNNLVVIGGIAVLLTLSAAIGILVPIEFGLAVGLFTVLVALVSSEPLADLQLFFEQNKLVMMNLIYCAGNATDAAIAIRSYLEENLPTAEFNIVRFFDIESSMAVIFSGENSEGETVKVTPLAICSCAEPTYSHGWEKAVGSSSVVTNPDGLAYNGIGWTGGAEWNAVQSGNRMGFSMPVLHSDRIDWAITTGATSLTCTVSIILNDEGGTSVQDVAIDIPAGTTASGYITLTAVQSLREVTATVGCVLSAFSFKAINV